MWAGLIGGLGLFLLGMGLMTDGLRALAGDGLRHWLKRVAGTRLRAFGTGAAATALIQSSSATSLIAIGLAGAGLIGLVETISLLIGANLGTTTTAYLVGYIGLRFSLATLALPIIGIAALMRIFLTGRPAIAASAMAGFGLLFIGVDLMQDAMAGLAGALAFEGHPLILVLIGIIMTVLVQSSSAAMAATIAAVAAGALGLGDAAFLVIGQNIGTTVTAVLAAVAGVPIARRAAGAHVVFNLGTAVPALILAGPMLGLAVQMAPPGQAGAPLALAYFHTMFNILGAVLFLPAAGLLARALERIVADPAKGLTTSLVQGALTSSASAMAALEQAIIAMQAEALHLTRSRMSNLRPPRDWVRRHDALLQALEASRVFLDRARRARSVAPRAGDIAVALDHLEHVALDLAEAAPVARADVQDALAAYVTRFRAAIQDDAGGDPFKGLPGLRRKMRARLVEDLAQPDGRPSADVRACLEALHWMDRIAWHLRRVRRALARDADSDPLRAAPDQAL